MGRPKTRTRAASRADHAAQTTALEPRSDSVYNRLTGLGGTADKGSVARPSPYVIPLSDIELRSAFKNSGITRRIVTVLPEKATRRGWTAPDVPETEEHRLRIHDRCGEAMAMARLYGGAPCLMVTEDDVPPAFRARPDMWLREPLDLQRVGKLHALQVFDAVEAAPYSYDEDLRSPGFRGPLLWSISTPRQQLVVHASRVVWFRGHRRPPSETRSAWGRTNTMPDDSVIQAVWDEIQRLCTVAQGGSILATEIRESVVKIAGLANKMTGDAAAAFQARLQLMMQTKSMLGLVVLGDNDSYENRSNSPQGWDKLHEGALTMLCMVLGWPRVMLTGEAPGGLSTDDESGLERERQIVSDYQERNRSEISRIYEVLYASQDGPTSGVVPDEWALTFERLDEPTEREVAELRDLVARTDATYINAGVYRAEDVTRSRFGESGWSLDLEPVEPIDEEEEARKAIERQRQMMEALGGAEPNEGGDEEEQTTDGRADAASDAVCVLVPAPDPGRLLREAVEQALGQPLVAPGYDPHVTVLYVGDGIRPRFELAEVVATVLDEAADVRSTPLSRAALRLFPMGPDGVPVVLEFDEAWNLAALNERLLRRLAHRVTAKQHRIYRAHLTLGYVAAVPSPEAAARLLAIDTEAVRVPVTELRVMVAGQVKASVMVGS